MPEDFKLYDYRYGNLNLARKICIVALQVSTSPDGKLFVNLTILFVAHFVLFNRS
jgi:hypothetical protein